MLTCTSLRCIHDAAIFMSCIFPLICDSEFFLTHSLKKCVYLNCWEFYVTTMLL